MLRKKACKRSFFVFFPIFLILLSSVVCQKQSAVVNKDKKSDGVNALLLVAKNYGLNYFLNRDVFEQYGWNIIHTGVTDTITACPPTIKSIGLHPIIPDVLVSDIKDINEYGCLAIMTASGEYTQVPDSFDDIRKSPEALNLISEALNKNLAVSAFCSGVRVLAAADVVRGKKVIGGARFKDEYEAAGARYLGKDFPPQVEENLITGARDLYYSFINSQAIMTVYEKYKGKTGNKDITEKDIIFENNAGYSDTDIIWQKTYGGFASEGAREVIETNDAGFLITGYTFSEGSGDADMLVIKTDPQGKTEWTKIIGGAGTEYGNACLELNDGYLITGYTTSFGAGSKDVYLVKLDKRGENIWTKTYGGQSWDAGTSLCESHDGNYIICGFTHSFGEGEEDVYLIKVDKNGNELWSKTYGGKRMELGNSVHQTDDGGFIISATTGTYGKGNNDYYLIKTDADGNETWTKNHGAQSQRGYGFDWCSEMKVTSDKGYIQTGYSDKADIMDAFVIKTDKNGNGVWAKNFGNIPFYDYGFSVGETNNGGFIIAGITKLIVKNRNVYNNEIALTKLDSNGNIVQEKSFGNEGSDWASSVIVARNGDFVVTGHTDSGGNGRLDIFLLRITGF